MSLEASSTANAQAAGATVAAAGRAAPPGRLRFGYREPHLAIYLLFLVFVVARYMQWGERREIFKVLRIEFVLGLLTFLACVMLLVMRPVDMRPGRRLIIAISALFAAMIVQLPFAADPLLARNIFVDRVIKFAMMTFFMIVLIRSPRYLRYFMAAFLFACFYITQESVHGLISGGLVWENQGIMRLHGAVPIYRHPNSLGGVSMGVVPFVVFLLPVVRSKVLRGGLLLLLGTAMVCVLYSGSRTAYVAFLAFAFYWWLVSRNKMRWLLLGVIIGAIGLVLVPTQYKQRFLSIGGEEAEGHSKEARIEILQDAMAIFLHNPLGVGVASFPAVRYKVFGRSQDTHNLYLEVATNLGVQGLVIFGFLVAVMMKSFRASHAAFRRMRRQLQERRRRQGLPPRLRRLLSRHDDDLSFMMAASRATEAFIFVRLVLGVFGMDLYEVYWWFAAGVAINLQMLAIPAATITDNLVEACRGADSAAA